MRIKKLPLGAIFLSLLATSIATAPINLQQMLELQVLDAFRFGGSTLITSHFTHCSWNHFIWDGITFLGLAAAYESSLLIPQYSGNRTAALLLAIFSSSIITSLGILASTDHFYSYRGLSGLCVTLYVMLSLDLRAAASQDNNHRIKRIAELGLLVLLIKISLEVLTGSALFVNASLDGYSVVIESHLFGAMAGLIPYEKFVTRFIVWSKNLERF